MKSLTSVSFFNKNNININDIPDSQLIKSNLIVCLDPYEIQEHDNEIYEILNKTNDYLLVEMVDLPLTTSDFKKKYNKKTIKEVNHAMGIECDYDILPNKKHIENIYNFIMKHFSEPFIVACSAGVSRSGALAHFLTYIGYDLDINNTLSNQKFIPNPLILNELILLTDYKFKNKHLVRIIQESEDNLIVEINNRLYMYRKYIEDGFYVYMGRSLENDNHFKEPILINDIYLYRGFGMELSKTSRI